MVGILRGQRVSELVLFRGDALVELIELDPDALRGLARDGTKSRRLPVHFFIDLLAAIRRLLLGLAQPVRHQAGYAVDRGVHGLDEPGPSGVEDCLDLRRQAPGEELVLDPELYVGIALVELGLDVALERLPGLGERRVERVAGVLV